MGKRVLIVGGVAGGASCAARLRRLDEDAEIILFERGEYISYANCGLPYHIGDVIKSRDALLLQTPVAMRAKYNVGRAGTFGGNRRRPGNKKVDVKKAESGEDIRGAVRHAGTVPPAPLRSGRRSRASSPAGS
jgi:NADPH-dependent 2,4-dienoyl-CoA reductase/sulfur reductase-like enzyme